MDLVNLDTSVKSSEGAVMYLRHPADNTILEHEKAGRSKKMYIKLLGRDSQEFMKAQHQINKVAEADRDSAMAASFTVDGEIFIDGKWIRLNSANAAEIYAKYTWILEQITVFVFDRSNFFPSVKKA